MTDSEPNVAHALLLTWAPTPAIDPSPAVRCVGRWQRLGGTIFLPIQNTGTRHSLPPFW
jgi:hypothetical protein